MTQTARKIKVAIAGVGNCASSLVQGVEYYRDADPNDRVPGLMHVLLGGYHVGDTEFVAAFDVDAAKVGLDLSKAVFASNNNTIRFSEVPALGVTVERGPTLDGLGTVLPQGRVEESPAPPVDVADVLRRSGAEVLVAYLPVGSEQAQKHYAAAALEAGVAFVNAIPVFIASDPRVGGPFHEGRHPDHRRRHQEPGWLHDRPPDPHPSVRGPGHGARPHLPAQRRRQHGLSQHAGA